MSYYFDSASVKIDLISAKDIRSDSVICYNCEKSDYLSQDYKVLRKINFLLISAKK